MAEKLGRLNQGNNPDPPAGSDEVAARWDAESGMVSNVRPPQFTPTQWAFIRAVEAERAATVDPQLHDD